MDKGFYIARNGDYIDKFVQNSGQLSLLAKGDGTEIMLQKIKEKEIVFIEPSDIGETMEFFYILEGEIEVYNNEDKLKLRNGDHFYVHHLKDTVQFTTCSEVTLLYFSTQPLFHYLSETIKDLTELAEKVEKKDMYTHSHIQRVKDYSVKIGNRLNLSFEKIENIAFASLFHDLGKINVPDEILNKPGELTQEEFECIKKHPIDGAELVEKTYYKSIGKIIEQHHERIDGNGYPNGLKGHEILIEAKIISVADSYDAMTTDRPYRKGLSPQEAVEELKRLRNLHYDKVIVDKFIEILEEEGIL